MLAVVQTRYGPPAALSIEDVPVPAPKPGEVLVKVRACALNASDWEFLTGKPAYVRAWGLRGPGRRVLGSDVAGVVEAVGEQVANLKVGDEVFGDVLYTWGGFAEYACLPASELTKKPAFLDFEQAAALPQSGCVAFQGLFDMGGLKPGEHVLINGAGGGSGSFAIQLAKGAGAEVTAVDRGEKAALMRSLGADDTVDFTREDCTAKAAAYDLILDFTASHPMADYRRALKKGGRYVLVGGDVPHLFATLLRGPLYSLTGAKMGILAAKPNTSLPALLGKIERGALRPVIDRRYGLREAPDALRRLGEGHAQGKLLVIP